MITTNGNHHNLNFRELCPEAAENFQEPHLVSPEFSVVMENKTQTAENLPAVDPFFPISQNCYLICKSDFLI